jgi:hypothetical protein
LYGLYYLKLPNPETTIKSMEDLLLWKHIITINEDRFKRNYLWTAIILIGGEYEKVKNPPVYAPSSEDDDPYLHQYQGR